LEALRPHQRGRAGLARQAAALRAAHEADWVGDLADWAEGWDFPRGLLALQLREGADDGALDDLAVRALFAWVSAAGCLGWKAKQVRELAEWRGLEQVGALQVSGAGLNARGLKQLQQPGRLAGLAALNLATNSLGDAGARALAGCAEHAV